MMMSPTAGGLAWCGLSTPIAHRLAARSEVTAGDALDGHVTGRRCPRSTTHPVWWWVMCLIRPVALWNPLRGHLLDQYEPS